MISLSHLDHLVLTVANIDKTCDFYRQGSRDGNLIEISNPRP